MIGLSHAQAREQGLLFVIELHDWTRGDFSIFYERVAKDAEHALESALAHKVPRTDRTVQATVLVRRSTAPNVSGPVIMERTVTIDDSRPRPTMVGHWRHLYKGLNRASRRYLSELIRLSVTTHWLGHHEAADALWTVITTKNEASDAIGACKRLCKNAFVPEPEPDYEMFVNEGPSKTVVSYSYRSRLV